MPNYDGSQVGVPYVRCPKITINDPPGALPSVVIEQAEAVRLADGSVRLLGPLTSITAEFNFALHALDPIPLINPENDTPLGPSTNLQNVFLAVLAVVRSLQLAQEAPPPPPA